jgi:hemolysin activation/secretion protein
MELEGGKARRITDVPGGAMSPTWGAGGEIAFAYYRHGEWHLWKMTVELGQGDWAPVPQPGPRDDYSDLFVKPVEDSTTHPLSDRWHLDVLAPLGLLNFASASTLTGRHNVYAEANLVGSLDGVRAEAHLGYLNLAWPINFYVDAFNVYDVFEERDIEREEHKFGFLAATVLPFSPYQRLFVGYTLYENRIVFEDEELDNTDPRNAGLVAALQHSNVYGRGLEPIGGFSVTLGAAWFTRGFGSQERRTNWFWSWSQYIRLHEDVVLVLRTQGLLSHGPDADVSDAASIVRGYRPGRVEGRNAAGVSAEIRFPIWRDINWTFPGQLFLLKDVRAYVFGDLGFITDDHAHNTARTTGHPDWRHSVGGGVRTDIWLLEVLPVPVGIEVAQPTDSHQSLRVSLTIGISF